MTCREAEHVRSASMRIQDEIDGVLADLKDLQDLTNAEQP
jgi:hypothetical protein